MKRKRGTILISVCVLYWHPGNEKKKKGTILISVCVLYWHPGNEKKKGTILISVCVYVGILEMEKPLNFLSLFFYFYFFYITGTLDLDKTFVLFLCLRFTFGTLLRKTKMFLFSCISWHWHPGSEKGKLGLFIHLRLHLVFTFGENFPLEEDCVLQLRNVVFDYLVAWKFRPSLDCISFYCWGNFYPC
jgi:hypothetical protein